MRCRSFMRAAGVVGALVGLGLAAPAAEIQRSVPRTLPGHPGNIFLAGESVVVAAPPGEVDTWRAVDYENKLVAKGSLKDGKAEVGPLPVGWYKIVRGEGHITNRTFVAVIEPLRAPTPLTSPIGIDVAMAWFFPKEKMGTVANLCQLAGISRVRDRLLWQEMEPRRGEFSGPNKYDDAAQLQHAAGLHILQVNHLSPAWATADARRFPPDLRDVYNFYRAMAQRWRDEVGAFEPWNEADIRVFGGHTGSEMATLQKAAYLGLKAGNPRVTACENVFAIRRRATLKDFQANEAWACFDTFNVHHYEPLENYPELYADYRAASAGKPMWVTECSVHVKWRGDPQLQELGDNDLRLQSERLVKTYTLALHEGVAAIYYFMLPHYVENKLQYGLLRPDLTPRPGYAALAAVGRLLADAKPLGRIASPDETVQGYVFRALSDGKPANVLVAWSETGTTLSLPKPPVAVMNHLGRSLQATNAELNLERAPIFALLPNDGQPRLIPPPKPARMLSGKPAHVVIQALLPETDVILDKSAYQIAPGQAKKVPMFLYNFGPGKVRGSLRVSMPRGWNAEIPKRVELEPGARQETVLTVTGATAETANEGIVRIEGDFGAGGKPLLALHFIATAK